MTTKPKTEYAFDDLISIARGDKTFEEVAKKYGVSVYGVRRAFYRRGLRIKCFPVLAHYNGRSKVFHSALECANKLGVARQTVVRSLQGKKTILDELDIKVEVYYGQEELYF